MGFYYKRTNERMEIKRWVAISAKEKTEMFWIHNDTKCLASSSETGDVTGQTKKLLLHIYSLTKKPQT